MDSSLRAAHKELGATEADVRSAARSTPFPPVLRQVSRKCSQDCYCCGMQTRIAGASHVQCQ